MKAKPRLKRCRFASGGQLLTPWQKIMRAGRRGTGARLTADDVKRLMSDEAIRTRAELDDLDMSHDFDTGG